MSMQFKVGDPVAWSSASAGITKAKAGVVVKVVKSGTLPWADVQRDKSSINMLGGDSMRGHESYLIRVDPQPPRQGKSKIYWPRVALLVKTMPA